MVSYYTGSDLIEIRDLGLKVKVTVTENVCKNDEKNVTNSNLYIFFKLDSISIGNLITVILIPNMTILHNKYLKKVLLTKNILRGCELAQKAVIFSLCNCANQLRYRGL